MTTSRIRSLIGDLDAERRDLSALLEGRAETEWSLDTPAEGWSIRDQIAHLAHFDAITRLAIADPEGFTAMRDSLPNLQRYVDSIGDNNREKSGTDLIQWWTYENACLLRAVESADAATRVPWFGPSMSLASKISARIMETWAHGQDVYDTLGLNRESTSRLRHIARIGVLAFPNSFTSHGLEIPPTRPFVSLMPPDGGESWTWGDPCASDTVSGPAVDFCLVVTQRRHVSDTSLEVSGLVANSWVRVAQAFAGPAGKGRAPGQFARREVS